MSLLCFVCGATFRWAYHLNAHLIRQHCHCPHCHRVFEGRQQCTNHVLTCDQNQCKIKTVTLTTCTFCKKSFSTSSNLCAHSQMCRTRHAAGSSGQGYSGSGANADDDDDDDDGNNENQWTTHESALSGNTNTFHVHVSRPLDIQQSMADMSRHLVRLLQGQIDVLNGIRWYVVAELSMSHLGEEQNDETNSVFIQSGRYIDLINERQLILDHVKMCTTDLLDQLDQLYLTGSNWTLRRVESIQLCTALYQPLGDADGGGAFIPTPLFLVKRKKTLLNIENSCDRCFLYCVAAALYPTQVHQTKPASYKHKLDSFNIKGITFPMQLNQISKFESQNRKISCNVFTIALNSRKIFPVRITQHMRKHHVDMLLLVDKTLSETNYRSHYILIKNFNAFCEPLVTKHKGKKFFCHLCLCSFTSAEKVKVHREHCAKFNGQRVRLPSKATALKFSYFQACEPVDFWVAADLECLARPLQTCENNPEQMRIHKTHLLEASLYSYSLMSVTGERVKPPVTNWIKSSQDTDIMVDFLQKLFKEYEWVLKYRQEHEYTIDPPSVAGDVDQELCRFCLHPLSQPPVGQRGTPVIVRDHDHTTPTSK